MATLLLHGQKVDTVFDLMGKHENDMTCALGWTLATCPQFCQTLGNRLVPPHYRAKDIDVQLQVWSKPEGCIDIELVSPPRFHVIVEAKRWQQPSLRQLRKYAARLRRSRQEYKCLAMLTNWSYSTAASSLTTVGGIPVVWVSWQDVAMLAVRAMDRSRTSQRLWIRELLKYLGGLITMQQEPESNWVFVVSLAKGVPREWKISWINVVEAKRCYFHPVGGVWPKTQPNYLAWRYDGKLQGIAHITRSEIPADVHTRIPEIPRGALTNHVLYRLGPKFGPDHDVPSGNIRNRLLWCMLDTLFTCRTILDAASKSSKREQQAKKLTT